MKTPLFALLLLLPLGALSQESAEPDAAAGSRETGTSTAGAGIGQGEADEKPTANPDGGGDGACVPLNLPEKTVIKEGNGWFPKVSPCGRYVAYGFGKVSVVDLTTGVEKPIDTRQAFTMGWIRPGTLSYVRSTGNAAADRYEASAPGFIPRKMTDDPGMVAGNQHGAADGHWVSWLAGGRLAYDNKVLATGVGGAIGTSQGWIVHAKTGENREISVWKNGVHARDYPTRTPLHEASIARGYITYGGYGPIRGIAPGGSDIDLTSSASVRFEGLSQVFFVGQGAAAKPWVASGVYSHALDKGWTVLKPWGERAGIVLDENASGMSVIDVYGTIVVARNNDKGKLTIVTVPAAAPRLPLDTVIAAQQAMPPHAR